MFTQQFFGIWALVYFIGIPLYIKLVMTKMEWNMIPFSIPILELMKWRFPTSDFQNQLIVDIINVLLSFFFTVVIYMLGGLL